MLHSLPELLLIYEFDCKNLRQINNSTLFQWKTKWAYPHHTSKQCLTPHHRHHTSGTTLPRLRGSWCPRLPPRAPPSSRRSRGPAWPPASWARGPLAPTAPPAGSQSSREWITCPTIGRTSFLQLFAFWLGELPVFFC